MKCVGSSKLESLYVYVIFPDNICASNAFDFISHLYSSIWDEALSVGNVGIASYVSGNIQICDYAPISSWISSNRYDAIVSNSELKLDLCVTPELIGIWFDLDALFDVSSLITNPAIYFFEENGKDIPCFSHVAVGGTFDRLHSGHRKLLAYAAGVARERLVIGITGDLMLSKKSYASSIASFEKRKSVVQDYLWKLKPHLLLDIVELFDGYGPTITDPSIECVVVSSETLNGGLKINEIRTERSFSPLSILITLRGDIATLSSTFLRKHIV